MVETVAKIGSGFTEEEMELLQEMLHKEKTKTAPASLEYEIEADFWVMPKHIVEVAFDEIKKSPT